MNLLPHGGCVNEHFTLTIEHAVCRRQKYQRLRDCCNNGCNSIFSGCWRLGDLSTRLLWKKRHKRHGAKAAHRPGVPYHQAGSHQSAKMHYLWRSDRPIDPVGYQRHVWEVWRGGRGKHTDAYNVYDGVVEVFWWRSPCAWPLVFATKPAGNEGRKPPRPSVSHLGWKQLRENSTLLQVFKLGFVGESNYYR